MAIIHLIEGPVGAGKSTFAAGLCKQHDCITLSLDDWMARLFSADKPDSAFMEWYVGRKARCIEQIWLTACDILNSGKDVVLELGLIHSTERLEFYDRMDGASIRFTVYFLNAARDVRAKRVQNRNQDKGPTFSMHVSDQVFAMASDMWQAPGTVETNGRDVRWIDT